jgi:DNA polymerase-1
MRFQVDTAFCEQLGSLIGLHVDQAAVSELEAEVARVREEGLVVLRAAGVMRPKRKRDPEGEMQKDTRAIRRLVYREMGGAECGSCGGLGALEEAGGRGGKTKYVRCLDCLGVGVFPPPGMRETEKGSISMSREVLEECEDPVIRTLVEVGRTDRAATTYIPYLRSAFPTLHPAPNVLLATGRSSYDGVIQLFPRSGKERACVHAGPGRVLISADYSQLELVTFAQIATWTVGRSDMADAIRAGRNLHVDLAAHLLGRSYEEVDGSVRDGDKEAKDVRQLSKIGNFGFLGGMGPFKLVQSQRAQGTVVCRLLAREHNARKIIERGVAICGECLAVAKDLRRGWLSRWTEAPVYFEKIARVVDEDGEIAQLVPAEVMGEPGRVASPRMRGGVDFSTAANTLFQGLAADGFKAAIRALTRACWLATMDSDDGPLAGTLPVVFVHDEVLCSSPRDRAEAAAAAVAEVMVAQMRRYVPDVAAGVKVEWKVSERWTK